MPIAKTANIFVLWLILTGTLSLISIQCFFGYEVCLSFLTFIAAAACLITTAALMIRLIKQLPRKASF